MEMLKLPSPYLRTLTRAYYGLSLNPTTLKLAEQEKGLEGYYDEDDEELDVWLNSDLRLLRNSVAQFVSIPEPPQRKRYDPSIATRLTYQITESAKIPNLKQMLANEKNDAETSSSSSSSSESEPESSVTIQDVASVAQQFEDDELLQTYGESVLRPLPSISDELQ
eukprot:TRINITY_DN467_c0_g2_i3.p1 TRINITY_DN467_c0_g2~~TRINITY_DN467_c0_g2_i3.p1  ORF type:complete len:166 (-),score=53.28 TRINITY_DN467_c0_g2_i3:19-516(-)